MTDTNEQDPTSYFADVVAFHNALGIPVGTTPNFELSPERMELRCRLIEEEVSELLNALDDEPPENVAKEAADVIVVVLGTMAEMGIPFDAVWRAVHESNMAKLGPNGEIIRREDGKVLKPPGWTAPDIAAVLNDTVPRCNRSKESRLY
jgi:predicted HAD superfamily Cof-like phosphohydrolase